MKKNNNLEDKNQKHIEINAPNKNTLIKGKKNIKKKKNNVLNKNENDPDLDLNTFCPDPDAIDKKIRSRTVRDSVRKGKLKRLMEEEKKNAIDPRKLLKTPQVMVPRLRPQKSSLNPTPLKLNPFSLKGSKLNVINEENIILSEREEESEKSESSSSSSFFDDKDKKENDEEYEEDECEEEEEDEECEKEEENIEKEEKKEDKKGEKKIEENIQNKKEKKDEEKKEEIKTNNNIPIISLVGCLKNEIKKVEEEKKLEEEKIEEEKKIEEENKIEDNDYENNIIEDILEDHGKIRLKDLRKSMKEERKSIRKKKDRFSIIESNIKFNYKKFKENVLDEEKKDEIIYENENDNINNLNNNPKCCPILDFYIKNTSIKAKS